MGIDPIVWGALGSNEDAANRLRTHAEGWRRDNEDARYTRLIREAAQNPESASQAAKSLVTELLGRHQIDPATLFGASTQAAAAPATTADNGGAELLSDYDLQLSNSLKQSVLAELKPMLDPISGFIQQQQQQAQATAFREKAAELAPSIQQAIQQVAPGFEVKPEQILAMLQAAPQEVLANPVQMFMAANAESLLNHRISQAPMLAQQASATGTPTAPAFGTQEWDAWVIEQANRASQGI